MSWTATTLTGMEGTDFRHIKRMNHPRASCSRRGAVDHKHETWCKQCFGRRLCRGSRGWTLRKTPRRRKHKERNDCIHELFQQILHVLMYWRLCVVHGRWRQRLLAERKLQIAEQLTGLQMTEKINRCIHAQHTKWFLCISNHYFIFTTTTG